MRVVQQPEKLCFQSCFRVAGITRVDDELTMQTAVDRATLLQKRTGNWFSTLAVLFNVLISMMIPGISKSNRLH